MFAHYLITRFNIQVSQFGPERMDSPPLTDEWLKDRLQLFIKYTVPSVLSQTNKEFQWLIYFDPDTPSFVLDEIAFLQALDIPIEFIFQRDYQGMLVDLVTRLKNSPKPFVISSRIDNDDIVSHEFIMRVRKAFVPKHLSIINFLSGYEYDEEARILKKWNVRYKNQFISLIESTENTGLQSVYAFPHWRYPTDAHAIDVGGDPMWIYLRHELNYSNGKITGIPVFFKPAALRLFPASVKTLPLAWWPTLKYGTRWFKQMAKRRLGIK